MWQRHQYVICAEGHFWDDPAWRELLVCINRVRRILWVCNALFKHPGRHDNNEWRDNSTWRWQPATEHKPTEFIHEHIALQAHQPVNINCIPETDWQWLWMTKPTTCMLVFYWPKKQNQWIVGTELQSPVYPTRKIGLEYPSLSNWNHRSSFHHCKNKLVVLTTEWLPWL